MDSTRSNVALVRRLTSMRARSFVLLLVVSTLAVSPAFSQARVLTSTKPPEPADESTIAACKTDLRLSGSVYDAKNPERSLAVFEVPSSHASAVYRLGSRVGLYELIAVVPRGVILRSSEEECWLRLVSDPNGNQRVAVKPKPHPKGTKQVRSTSRKAAAVVIGGTR